MQRKYRAKYGFSTEELDSLHAIASGCKTVISQKVIIISSSAIFSIRYEWFFVRYFLFPDSQNAHYPNETHEIWLWISWASRTKQIDHRMGFGLQPPLFILFIHNL